MTIKDIELRSGMTRANIRYYESLGLLSPARGENGYRDYSEVDLDALLKIKLLRSLEVSLEDIGALSCGERELSEVLARQMEALEAKEQELHQARELCRRMRSDAVDYQSLDAEHYLDLMRVRSEAMAAARERDRLRTVPHPFRRFFARSVDYGICHLIIYTLITIFGANITQLSDAADFFVSVGTVLLTLCLEPVLLHFFGSTPGKWIFGMYVRDINGEKPGITEGFYRYWDIIRYGYGFFIPFYSIYRLWKSMTACLDEDELPWESETVLHIRDTRPWRIGAYIGSEVCYTLLIALLVVLGAMPKHSGELTRVEFAENFNRYAAYCGMDNDLYLITDSMQDAPNFVPVMNININTPSFAITEEDGHIVSISITKQNRINPQPYSDRVRMQLAALSFIRAQPGAVLHSREMNKMLEYMDENPYTDFTWSLHGVEVICDYELEGYLISDYGNIFEDPDASEHYYALSFTMSLEN